MAVGGAVVLLTGGAPDRPTGGNLYNHHLIASMEGSGAEVLLATVPPDDYPRLAVVDSIAMERGFPWIAVRPPGTVVVALMHMLPSLHVRSADARLRWRRLEMAFLRRVDLVIAASRDLARWLLRVEVPEERLRVIPPGKDGPQPPPDSVSSRGSLDAGSSDLARLRLLCVANWFPVKNLTVLIRTLADLPPEVQLDLVGDPTVDSLYAASVWEAIRRHSLTDRVHVHGPVPQGRLGMRYAAADVFVLPSAHEGYATVVAEALWYRLPVVATAAGGIPDLVTSGAEGFLVPVGQPRALAAAIRRLHDDVALRRRMAAAAAKRGQSLPSWGDAREALSQLLTGMIHGQRASDPWN